jgi:hypothetical protein
MGKNIRHRDEVLKTFSKDVHETAHDEQSYNQIRDTVMIEILCDIRDNLHFIAGNIRDFNYDESDIEDTD